MTDFSFGHGVARVATSRETAEALHITERKLRTIRNAGLIGFHRIGKHYSYTEEDVQEFLSLTEGIDLSNDDKIIAFGLTQKKARAAAKQGTYRDELNRNDS